MDAESHEQQPSLNVVPVPESNELGSAGQSGDFVGEAEATKAVEQAMPPASQSAPTLGVPAPVPTQSPSSQPANQPVATSPTWMPQIADDTDLIEKEWVDKAKEIVAQTAHDPHLQNKEINKVRAEYLKKRYNKDLKQSD